MAEPVSNGADYDFLFFCFLPKSQTKSKEFYLIILGRTIIVLTVLREATRKKESSNITFIEVILTFSYISVTMEWNDML